jgi:peptide/nickel transport system substrate-binding protein
MLVIAILLLLAACGAPTPPPTIAPTPTPVQAAPTSAPAPTVTPAPTTAAAPTAAPAAALPADAAPVQTLRIAIQGFGSQEPLAPWSVRWGGQNVAAYEFLSPVYADENFGLRPLLASSITPNTDFTVWTIKLDPRALWSDGSKLTAKQVKDAWEWETLPAQKTSNITGNALADARGFADLVGGKATELSGLVVKDDQTLEAQLNNPDRFLADKFGTYWLGVAPVDKLKADAQYLTKPNPIVNGPYQVTQIDVTGRQIVLQQNPKWWGAKPSIQRIEVNVVEDQTAWQAVVEKGQAEYSLGQDDTMKNSILSRVPGATKLSYKLPGGVYASFHWNVPPADDVNVRKALIHAIDFKQLAPAATDNLQLPWLAALHPDLLQGCYNKDSESLFAFDPAKAKQEVAASKYGAVDKLGKIRLSTQTTSATVIKAFQIILEMWRTNLGLTNVELQPQPSGFGADERLLNVDRQSLGARPPDDGLWISQLRSTGIHATRFMAGYKNDSLDKLIDQITGMDRKNPAFCKTVQQAEMTFLNDYMLIPLWRQNGSFGITLGVKDLKLNPYVVAYGLFEPPFAYVTKR